MRWDTPARQQLEKRLETSTQAEIQALLKAVGLGVSQQTISRWAAGEDRPSEDKRPLIRQALGITETDWLTSAGRGLDDRSVSPNAPTP